MKWARVLLVAAVVAALLFWAVPAFAGDEVVCTVDSGFVAVSVSPESIDYGLLPWEAQVSSVTDYAIEFTATNTGNTDMDLGVKGSNAEGAMGAWTLNSVLGVDQFVHVVEGLVDPVAAMALTLDYQAFQAGIAPAGTQTFSTLLAMPSAGSAGSAHTTTVTLMATEAVP